MAKSRFSNHERERRRRYWHRHDRAARKREAGISASPRNHVWRPENIKSDQRGIPLEWDDRCISCGEVRHVTTRQPVRDEQCPGPPGPAR